MQEKVFKRAEELFEKKADKQHNFTFDTSTWTSFEKREVLTTACLWKLLNETEVNEVLVDARDEEIIRHISPL